MTLFSDLIKHRITLLYFCVDWHYDSEGNRQKIRNVATEMMDDAKVFILDVEKNVELAERLNIVKIPTVIIYKHSHMVWRKSNEVNEDEIIAALRN